MLFFGCRSAHADYFFAKEWVCLEGAGLVRLYTAFSRDQEYKVYVQHLIEREGAEVWRWIGEKQAHVLIAGYVLGMWVCPGYVGMSWVRGYVLGTWVCPGYMGGYVGMSWVCPGYIGMSCRYAISWVLDRVGDRGG